jgi:hypothetical protein
MLGPNSDQRLGLCQSLEADGTTIGLAPLDLLLDVMEERHDIAKAVLDIDVTVSNGDQDDLEVFRRGGESEKHGHYIVAALTGNQYEVAKVIVDGHTGSVSMMILRGAMVAIFVWFW